MHTAPYFTVLGLLTIIHALRVVRLRLKYRVGLGDGGHEDLLVAIRIFGNHSEYVPMGLVLLAVLEFVQAPVWYMHLTGASLVLGRLLHMQGLLTTKAMSWPRATGITLTFVSLFLAAAGATLFTWLPG